MEEAELQFKIMASEHFPERNAKYVYSVLLPLPSGSNEDRKWKNEEIWFSTIEDLAKDLTRYIVGTRTIYFITSEPIEGLLGIKKEGISGYSNNFTGMTITRKLNEQEMSSLCGNISAEIEKYKRRIEEERD